MSKEEKRFLRVKSVQGGKGKVLCLLMKPPNAPGGDDSKDQRLVFLTPRLFVKVWIHMVLVLESSAFLFVVNKASRVGVLLSPFHCFLRTEFTLSHGFHAR